MLHVGGWAPDTGRFRRWENLGRLGDLLDRALTTGTPATPRIQAMLANRWQATRAFDGLSAAIEWRARTRRESLENRLAQRRDAERRRITANLDQFAATLQAQLAKGDEEDALFSAIQARSKDEIAQYHRDRRSWQERLQRLDLERDAFGGAFVGAAWPGLVEAA